MGSNTTPEHPNVQATEWTTTNPPGGPVAAGLASMFNNAHGNHFTGNQFHVKSHTTNLNTVNDPLAVIHKRVAPNAILNAGGRADEVRCDPDTRKEFLGHIFKWRNAQDSQTPPILWLSGPAGAGKSAIAQTVAERCNEEAVPQANFFFFRGDSSRSSLSPLVATLVHQIVLLYPSLRDPVATVLSENPLIFDSILENQLKQLIAIPLHTIQQSSSSSYVAPLIVIDGLDECESEQKRDQRKILLAFNKVLTAYPHLFCLLVASRDEPQIRATFNQISNQLLSLDLNDQDSAHNDIRVFVNNEFKRLRTTHPLAHSFDASWPSVRDVNDIVWKSSGQFIYAATVMRFLTDSPTSPILSLARVQGATAQLSTLTSPFSYLDAVYTYILSQSNDREMLKDILRAQLFLDLYMRTDGLIWIVDLPGLLCLLRVYNPKYTEAIIQSCLVDLTPIAKYGPKNGADELLFHHASFSDYLLDCSRSGDYFVDVDVFNIEIMPAVMANPKLSKSAELGWLAYFGLQKLSRLPPGFLEILAALDPSLLDKIFSPIYDFTVADMFKHVFTFCTCEDDVRDYKQILRRWIYTQDLDSTFIHQLETEDYHWPPYSYRYLAMAYVDRNPTTDPFAGHIGVSIHPETPSDAHETAIWLKDLLNRLHSEIYYSNIREYNRLLDRWTTWAVGNNIPLVGVDDLPNARAYLRWRRIEKWVGQTLKIGTYA